MSDFDILNDGVNTIKIYSFTLNEEFYFKSFLTDFSDKFASNWNTQEIYGRMDPIYTFKNTVRKISLAFDVPSMDLEDSRANSINAEKLIAALYPVYNEANGLGVGIIGSPPFVRVKLANLITNVANIQNSDDAQKGGLLGWLDGFTFKPELDSGFFVDAGENKLFPKLFKASFTLNVLHEHALGYVVKSSLHVPRVTFKKTGVNPFAHSYGISYTPAPNDPPPTPPPTVADPQIGAGTVLSPPTTGVKAAVSQAGAGSVLKADTSKDIDYANYDFTTVR